VTDVSVNLRKNNVPVNGLATLPTYTVQRMDTGVEVVSDANMTDRGTRGLHTFSFASLQDIPYNFLIDADPIAADQVDIRYWSGAFDGDLLQVKEIMEGDQEFNDTTGKLKYLRKGTAVELIAEKDVVGSLVGQDSSIKQP